MYEQIKNDITQKYYMDNFPNDGQRFIAWYLRNIHNLDICEVNDCITDGAGDKQIDAIYVDNQNSIVYIIQGKFYSGGSIDSEPLREVLSSWIQIKDLAHLQDGANKKLQGKILDLSKAIADDYDVCFELVTTSKLTPSASDDLVRFQDELSNSDNLQANIVLVDSDSLKFKYEEALNRNRPYINYDFQLENGRYMELSIDGVKAIIAAIPLKACLEIPGIKDGALFRKNVRQSLGSNNKVNKNIAKTIKSIPERFFFLHNGITAICSKMVLKNDVLSVKELNVVNGCQSLTTIYYSSASVEKANDAYIMFKIYEIDNSDRADEISTCTNSQSTVKPRDLRSNDKSVLEMKKEYEQYYTDGYFVTKRGEQVDNPRINKDHIVELSKLGQQLIAWHSQRPIYSYSETRIFDKYFDQLFHRKYSPENMQSLNELSRRIEKQWIQDNPLGLNPSLLAMKSYAPHHHLYAISVIICEANKMIELVPNPSVALKRMKESSLLEFIIEVSGNCLNMAFEAAANEKAEKQEIFSPQNWSKSKESLKDIRTAIKNYLSTLKMMPNGKELYDKIINGLSIDKDNFEARWTAD